MKKCGCGKWLNDAITHLGNLLTSTPTMRNAKSVRDIIDVVCFNNWIWWLFANRARFYICKSPGVFFISALLTRSDPQAVNTAKNYCLLSNRLRQQNVLTVKTALDDDNIDWPREQMNMQTPRRKKRGFFPSLLLPAGSSPAMTISSSIGISAASSALTLGFRRFARTAEDRRYLRARFH